MIHPIVTPVEYKFERPSTDGKKGRETFRNGILGCFSATDCGLNCCVAHTCCGICLWNNTMSLIPGLKSSSNIATAATILGRVAGDNCSPIGCVATYLRTGVREQLVGKIFPEGKSQGTCRAYLAHCCCTPCAIVQDVDAVMAYSDEKYGKPLEYGKLTSCKCVNLKAKDGNTIYMVPNSIEPVNAPLFGLHIPSNPIMKR